MIIDLPTVLPNLPNHQTHALLKLEFYYYSTVFVRNKKIKESFGIKESVTYNSRSFPICSKAPIRILVILLLFK
jgi:hypothetical protein